MTKWLRKITPSIHLLLVVVLVVGMMVPFFGMPSRSAHAATWWNELWGQRIQITFDHSAVATNVTSFPVGIHLDDTVINWSVVQDDGDDIRFVDSDDSTYLPYEIELWDDGNDAWLWVQVPQIDGGSSTDFIYMYYSNAGASAGESAVDVWDSNYVGVYHFSEASGTIYDSTTYANNSTASNNVTYAQTGGFGHSVATGVGSYIDLSDSTDFEFNANDAFSIESYVYTDATGSSTPIFTKMEDNTQNEYWFGIEGDNSFGTLLDNDGSGWATGTTTRQSGLVVDSTWVGLATTVSNTNIYEWQDGAAASPNPSYAYSSGIFAGTAAAVIANHSGHVTPFTGKIDELRISKIQRSADWIEASYLSITEASQSYAAAEGAPSVTVTTNTPTWGTTTATLSGTLNGMGGESTVYVYFSWGLTAALGTNTTEQAKGATGAFTQGITGLTMGETYFVRANARYDTNQYVTGSIVSFTTSATENWLGTYTYRQDITVAKTTTKTDYPVELIIHKGTGTTTDNDVYLNDGAKSWAGIVSNDLRFTQDDGTTELSYYIQDGASSTTEAVVWVEVPSISSTPSTFYVYYGKVGDITTSSIENTFTYGTDFEDYSVGTIVGQSGWTEYNSGHAGSMLVEDVSGDRGVTTFYGGNAHHAVSMTASEGYAVLAWAKRTGGDQALWINLKDSTTGVSISNTAVKGYNFAWAAYTNTYHRLFEGDGTSGTALTSQVAGSMATGVFYELDSQWYGSTLKGYVNDVEKLSASDATYSSGTYLGLATGRNPGNEFFFSWIAVRQYDGETITYGGGTPGGTGVPVMTTGSYTSAGEASMTLWGTLVSTNSTVTLRGFDYGGAYEDSTVVVVPDMQGMIDNPDWYYYLENMFAWIVANQGTYNIEAVLQVGDVTNYGYQGDTTKALEEWVRADALFDSLDDAGIKYLVVPGNHEYEFAPPPSGYPDASDRILTHYNTNFGPARFAGDDWWEGDNTGNSVISFDMGGVPFMAIGLQFGPTDADLAWARSVINSNPGRSFFIVTHAYMDDDNTRLDATDAHSTSFYFSDGSDNNGEEMFTELVSQYPQIVAVFSGHVITADGAARRVDYVGGEPVTQILQNYQMYSNGGTGYYRRYDLDPSDNIMYAYTSSVDAGALSTDPHQFSFAFRSEGSAYQPFAYSATESSTSYPTGTYSLVVDGLNPNVSYQYRAKAYNAEGWGYGSAKTFTTADAPAVPGAPTLSVSSTSSQINVAWVKGSGAVSTVVRYDKNSYPTTPTSGLDLYSGTGTTATLTTAQSGVTYYFSAWGLSSGAYSTTYDTATGALGLQGTLPNPSVFQIESVKVFRDYLTTGDLLVVMSNQIIMGALPAEDIQDSVTIQILDGTTVRTQGVPSQWGYRPSSVYLAPDHGLVWKAGYVVSLEGRDWKWASAPTTTYDLGAGSWIDDDSSFTYLQNWILSAATRMENYYYDLGYDLVSTTAAGGYVLTIQGGEWFERAIPGLRDRLPSLFGTGAAGIDVYEKGELAYQGQDTQEDAWGEYYAGQIQALGESAGLDGAAAGAVIWTIFMFVVLGVLALVIHPSLGIVISVPFIGVGVNLKLYNIADALALGIALWVLAMFLFFIGRRNA